MSDANPGLLARVTAYMLAVGNGGTAAAPVQPAEFGNGWLGALCNDATDLQLPFDERTTHWGLSRHEAYNGRM